MIQRNALEVGLLLEDRDSRLDVGRLDVRDETPLEAVSEPLLQVGDVLRHLVRGEHHLPTQLVQCVEGVEELLLRALASREQLHVVEDEHVDTTEALLELAHAIMAERADQVVDEGLRRQVADLQRGLLLLDLMADGVGEMRLAESDAAVDEERVVVVAGLARDRLGGGVRELVGRPDDEVRERVLAVQLGVRRTMIEPAARQIDEQLALIA